MMTFALLILALGALIWIVRQELKQPDPPPAAPAPKKSKKAEAVNQPAHENKQYQRHKSGDVVRVDEKPKPKRGKR